ncbi:hypothetical protein [Lentilactobacillus sp. Marseille-Q4993]|nr:hypothetical protein [Lentilactobacillus sp. Marseille-Q4993]
MGRQDMRKQQAEFSMGHATKSTGYTLLAISVVIIALLAIVAKLLM